MTRCFADAARQWGYLALSLLGWSVADFWRATPEELRMALAPPPHTHAALDRDTLDKLLAQDRAERKAQDG